MDVDTRVGGEQSEMNTLLQRKRALAPELQSCRDSVLWLRKAHAAVQVIHILLHPPTHVQQFRVFAMPFSRSLTHMLCYPRSRHSHLHRVDLTRSRLLPADLPAPPTRRASPPYRAVAARAGGGRSDRGDFCSKESHSCSQAS
eukprot:1621471-Rhodomonas_salina.1